MRLPLDIFIDTMAAADIDGDEDIDLLAAGRSGPLAGAIAVLTNDGAGGFAAHDRFETTFELNVLAMADVDGDGDVDAVARGCADIPGIAVVRLDHGGLVDVQEFQPAGYGCGLAIGDIDGDRAVDLLVTADSGILALNGRRDGQFDEPVVFDFQRFVSDLGAGDLDADGRAEIVVMSAGQVLLYEDDGTGALVSSTVRGDGDVMGIAVDDLEGDGDVDVAAWTLRSTHLYRNDARGTLLPDDPGPAVPSSTRGLANVDGSGDLDWVGPTNDGILVVPGEGGLHPPELVHSPLYPSAYALGDLDQDGDTDLAFGSSEVVIVPGESGDFPHRGAPIRRPDSAQEPNPESVALGDLDGDGTLDAAVTHEFGLSLLHLRDAIPSAWTELGAFGERVESVLALDLEPDGDLDIACVAEDPNLAETTFFLFENDGTGRFDRVVTEVRNSSFEAAASGDLDADGDPDLALAANDGSLTIGWNLGNAVVDLSDSLPVGAGAEAVVIADLNGDSVPDIATANDIDDTVSLVWGPRFGEPDVVPISPQPEALAAGDLDNDDDVDLVVVHGTAAQPVDLVSVLSNDGAGGFGAIATFEAPGDPRGVALGDADLDGDLDVAVACAATGTSGRSLVLLFPNDGAGELLPPTTIAVGSGPFAVAFADLDDDCGPDLVVVDKGSSDLSVVLARDP